MHVGHQQLSRCTSVRNTKTPPALDADPQQAVVLLLKSVIRASQPIQAISGAMRRLRCPRMHTTPKPPPCFMQRPIMSR
jgi:hypothetical protein